jgi:hypothetical protein
VRAVKSPLHVQPGTSGQYVAKAVGWVFQYPGEQGVPGGGVGVGVGDRDGHTSGCPPEVELSHLFLLSEAESR